MKKLIVLFLAAALSASLAACSLFAQKVSVKDPKKGTARFETTSGEILNSEISSDDLSKIAALFDGKEIYRYIQPSCGFSLDVSVTIDGKTFCIGCDTCGTVQYFEALGYFNLNEAEKLELYSILDNYGFHFPCI